MTDFLPDSPVVARPYCPGCEPLADLMRETLDARYCSQHNPDTSGAVDHAAVGLGAYLASSAEAGGDANRRWCDFLHRGAE